jgi:outer membrane usher protein
MIDLLGNQQTFTVPYYVSSNLLKPGLSSFSYEIGLLRKSFGIKSNDYSAPALILTHRQGIFNNYTVGWHGEASRHHLLGSIDQTFLIGQLGTLSLSTATQYSKQKPQGLLSVSAEHQAANSIGFGGRLTYATAKFRDISMLSVGYYPKMALQSFVSGSHENWGNLTLSFTSTRTRDHRSFQFLTTNYQKPLSNNFYLSISLGHQFKDKKEKSLFISLNYSFGEGRTGSISQSQTTDYSRTNIGFQQNILGELGTGYRLRTSHESNHHLEYEAELSNSHSYGSIQSRSYVMTIILIINLMYQDLCFI